MHHYIIGLQKSGCMKHLGLGHHLRSTLTWCWVFFSRALTIPCLEHAHLWLTSNHAYASCRKRMPESRGNDKPRMCVCISICMVTYMSNYIILHMHVCIYAYILHSNYVHVKIQFVYMNCPYIVKVFLLWHVSVQYVCMYIYIYMLKYIHICIYIYIYTYIYIYIYIYTYIYIYICIYIYK